MHEEQRITLSRLSSGKIITNFCSTLENTRLLIWGKNSKQLGHQQSKSNKFNTVTSQQSTTISLPKFKSIKPVNCPKHQVFELPRKMRLSIWLYDILIGMLMAGVYSMDHILAPTLEDIKNKLRSSGGIGGYGMG